MKAARIDDQSRIDRANASVNRNKKGSECEAELELKQLGERASIPQTCLVQADITKSPYGKLPDGSSVNLYTLTNRQGITAKFLNWGATLAELHGPDRNGNIADITLGFDSMEGWLNPGNPYMGSTVGRFANRIAQGRFTLDERTYSLAINNGTCSLHGGLKGFDKVIWYASEKAVDNGVAVEFRHTSPDGDEGYPGTLEVSLTCTLTDSNELRLDYHAEVDKPTVLNLTNHTYWNLSGDGDVLGHIAQILSSKTTEVNGESIPNGKFASVTGTPFDFRNPTSIGSRLSQIGNNPVGYDHNYVLDGDTASGPSLVAQVKDPVSGRVLTVLTTEPGVQFYTGNYLDGSLIGKYGRKYYSHHGFCLETQHFPDSPNHSQFPSVVLRPGEHYRQTTIHRFSTAA